MIAHLKGKILHKDDKHLVLEVNGIGYEISTLFEVIEKAVFGSELDLWIYHHIREDASDLYGFELLDEKHFFELLLSVSGIGPKTALNILNIATIDALRQAASTGDTSHLVKVSGVGKKMAEKIVLELKGKFNSSEDTVSLKSEVEAIEALKALGYSQSEAREALKQIPETLTTPEERIRAALKLLGK